MRRSLKFVFLNTVQRLLLNFKIFFCYGALRQIPITIYLVISSIRAVIGSVFLVFEECRQVNHSLFNAYANNCLYKCSFKGHERSFQTPPFLWTKLRDQFYLDAFIRLDFRPNFFERPSRSLDRFSHVTCDSLNRLVFNIHTISRRECNSCGYSSSLAPHSSAFTFTSLFIYFCRKTYPD